MHLHAEGRAVSRFPQQLHVPVLWKGNLTLLSLGVNTANVHGMVLKEVLAHALDILHYSERSHWLCRQLSRRGRDGEEGVPGRRHVCDTEAG